MSGKQKIWWPLAPDSCWVQPRCRNNSTEHFTRLVRAQESGAVDSFHAKVLSKAEEALMRTIAKQFMNGILCSALCATMNSHSCAREEKSCNILVFVKGQRGGVTGCTFFCLSLQTRRAQLPAGRTGAHRAIAAAARPRACRRERPPSGSRV